MDVKCNEGCWIYLLNKNMAGYMQQKLVYKELGLIFT